MPPPKPTLLFVHGAFSGPETFSAVAALLQQAGFACNQTVALHGTGGPPNIGLDDDAAVLRAAVLAVLDGGDDCVVVLHSYAGAVGAQGLAGLGPRDRGGRKAVRRMVYVAANIPRRGESHLGQCVAFAASLGVEVPPVLDVQVGFAWWWENSGEGVWRIADLFAVGV